VASARSAVDFVPVSLTWSVAHEVGVPAIDKQHAALVLLLNNLASALRNGEKHEPAFHEVVRYTEFHFSTEERLMRAARYDGATAHKDMHRRLLEDLRGLCLNGDGMSVSLTLRYLQEWLLRHVDGADRDLAIALNAAGLVASVPAPPEPGQR
jgi:hemerythrin